MKLSGLMFALCALGGCGPSVATPTGEGSTSGASGADGTDSEGSTATPSGSTSRDGASTSTASDGSSESTGSGIETGSSESTGPAVPPPNVLGEWVCLGEPMPFFLRIDAVEGSDLTGSACVESDPGGEPQDWDACDELANHPPLGSAYQVLASLGSTGTRYELEFGFTHDPKTDILFGARFPAAPPYTPSEQSCERHWE